MSGLSGQEEGGQKTRGATRLAVLSCLCMSQGWQGLSPPAEFPAALQTRGVPWAGRAALQEGEVRGVWDGGWKGWHGREEKGTVNEQQRRAQVKLGVG